MGISNSDTAWWLMIIQTLGNLFIGCFSPDMDNNYSSTGYIGLLQWEYVIVVIY
jgi:hypothetical protein